MTKEEISKLKHGDKIIVKVGWDEYESHIEERFVTKSPSKKRALFVVFDSIMRMPIQLDSFLKFYGTIEKKDT